MIVKLLNKSNSNILRQNWSEGDGLKFDGVNDYISFSNTILNIQYTTAATLSAIIKVIAWSTGSVTNACFFAKTNYTSASFGVLINMNSGGIFLDYLNGSGIRRRWSHAQTFNLNQTYHLIIDFSNRIVYVDGVAYTMTLVINTGTIGTIPNNNLRINVVYDVNTQQWPANMIISDYKFFNKALTSAEAATLYQTKNQYIPSTAIANCILDMQFADKQGTIAKDSSGSGTNGTLVNYAAGTTTLGASNSWKDRYGNAITQL